MSYCDWKAASALDRNYHDTEWGVPVHDDRAQFEHLSMEVMQCGLNWELMLKKRDVFRKCFKNFDFERVAKFDESDIARVMKTPGMIRSERKIRAVVGNAVCFKKIREEFGSFCKYLWNFSDGKTILYDGHENGKIPVSNALSKKISDDLKHRGFKYTGPITVYSHLQASGLINDHAENCPCYKKIVAAFPTVKKRREGEVF